MFPNDHKYLFTFFSHFAYKLSITSNVSKDILQIIFYSQLPPFFSLV